MEKFSRVLTVMIAALSVAFMGFAGVVSFGGPNWEAEARRLDGYTFEPSEGQNPIWTATRSVDRQNLGTTSAILPEVMTAAMQDHTSLAKAERDRLANEVIPGLEQWNQNLTAVRETDGPALEAYLQVQIDRLAQTQSAIETASQEQETLAGEIRKVEDQLVSRREDVFRMELEHRVLTADVERVRQNVAVVTEQIHLLEDELDKAERRKRELDARGLPVAASPGSR